jgi:hypothetical protein
MTMPTVALPWRIEDLDWSRLDVERVRANDALFVLVCGASFTESGSDTYSRNLIAYFADDDEVGRWLRDHWEPEELQHGRALKTYVQRVWPAFDWDAAYAAFFAEYAQTCVVDQYEPTAAREMAARCIVEMGTTTFYQTLSAVCDEPVLKELAWRIRGDEVQHYKHFYGYFLRYRQHRRFFWPGLLASIARRVLALRGGDADIALRHAAAHWIASGAGASGRLGSDTTAAADPENGAEIVRRAYRMMSLNYPMELAVRMALKPLQLQPFVIRMAQRPLAAFARHQILR